MAWLAAVERAGGEPKSEITHLSREHVHHGMHHRREDLRAAAVCRRRGLALEVKSRLLSDLT